MNNSTPLHIAAKNGNKEEVEVLIRAGVKVDAVDGDDWTPLHLATRYGHKEIVEILIRAGAKVDAAEKDGWTPLHLAARYGHKEVAEVLIHAGANIDAAAEKDGWTPLYIAVINGNKEIAGLLISAGAKKGGLKKMEKKRRNPVQMTVLTPWLNEKLKKLAAMEDRTISKTISIAVREYVEKKEKEEVIK